MENKIKSLINLNAKHSEQFCSDRLDRELYLAKHPTQVVAFKCMDGRIHLPTITHTPLGIIRPYRNIGGKFNLGWPLLNNSFDNLVIKSVSKGNQVLVLVTYHFSEGDEHRGCAGFKYDCEAAKKFTVEFREQIQRIYGKSNRVVCPIIVGIETDKDAMLLHGEKGEVLDLSRVEDKSETSLKTELRKIYPTMPQRILEDLLPLVQGNIEHIAETKGQKPMDQLVHGEWILAVGKGFDWLHTPNMALIVGPYDPNIGDPIKTAASIIKSNMEARRVDKGFVVLSSAVYADPAEYLRTKERTLYLNQLAKKVVEDNFPEIVNLMNTLAVVVDVRTMKMEAVGQLIS